MMHARQFQRSAALAGSVLFAALGAQAAGSFTVQNGTWIVTSEVNGQPGRGMAIDVQDNTLVMQVYNYESSGQPTFHLSFGAMDGNHYSGTLTRYKNGRYFGSGPLDGVEDKVVGNVQIDFTSADTGTIQFPGETAVAISRFNFDMIPEGTLSRPKFTEQWILAELDATDKPVNAIWLQTGEVVFSPDPKGYPTINQAQSFKDGNASSTPCSYSASTEKFTCNIQFDGTPGKRKLEWSKNLESMSGTISATSGCAFSPCPPTSNRVVGMRLGTGDTSSAAKVDWQMDTLSDWMTAPVHQPAPDPGTWIVSSELTGKPGRGMAIDVQYDTLVMQVYNYEKSGEPTFHLAVAPYKQGAATGHLKRYEGGRYYGGPALSGHEVADVGEVSFKFNTPTLGTIQFPGESPVTIQRYQFGATEPSPESLLGDWIFFSPGAKDDFRFSHFTINQITSSYPDEAWGLGGMAGMPVRCSYPNGLWFAIRCTDQMPGASFFYEFTPINGRAVGQRYRPNLASEGIQTMFVLRVKDRHGNLAGLGKF